MDEDISARRRASIRRPGAPEVQPVTAARQDKIIFQKNLKYHVTILRFWLTKSLSRLSAVAVVPSIALSLAISFSDIKDPRAGSIIATDK